MESTVSQAAPQFSITPVQSIMSIQPSQPETHDGQEKPDAVPAQHTHQIRIGASLVQVPASAREVYEPDIIEKTLATTRQLGLDFNAVESQMGKITSLIDKTREEQLEARSKEVAALG